MIFSYHFLIFLLKVNHEEFCREIREAGMKVGIALKPKTEIDDRIRKLIESHAVDHILVMTVGMDNFVNFDLQMTIIQ